MKLTPANMNKVINTPEVKSLVASYLLQRVYSEITREQIDSIYLKILTDNPVWSDRLYRGEVSRQIFKGGDLYLCSDDGMCQKIYDMADVEERKQGIKPSTMEKDFCPALVAESDLSIIAHEIIRITGNPFGVTIDKLLSSGMESYNKWIDLVVSAIISMPDFVNPLVEI